MKAAIIGLVAVVVIGGGRYLLLHKSQTKTNSSPSSQTQDSSSSTQSSGTITFDGTMFSPASLSVKTGTTVTIKNTSSEELQFDSDPHPVHTDDTDLNVGAVPAGQSKTFMVTKAGTFGYHDHLDPSIQGKITIQ
jgi:plastocyanin